MQRLSLPQAGLCNYQNDRGARRFMASAIKAAKEIVDISPPDAIL
jgi:hypothetical protein